MMRRRGFTLIEILATILIISVLLGLLMPALAAARARGRLTACASNLRQIGLGFRSYLQGNEDIFPYASLMPSVSPVPLPIEQEPIFISQVLAPHLSDSDKVFYCAMDYGERDPPNSGKPYFVTEKSSYEYRTGFVLPGSPGLPFGFPGLCGRSMAQVVKILSERPNNPKTLNENEIWIMRDYGNFHAAAGKNASRRYLYYDGRVEDFEN